MLFSQTIPPSFSSTESKSLLFTTNITSWFNSDQISCYFFPVSLFPILISPMFSLCAKTNFMALLHWENGIRQEIFLFNTVTNRPHPQPYFSHLFLQRWQHLYQSRCRRPSSLDDGGVTWFFSSYGGILELRRGIQDAYCVGPGKSNLPFELRRKAGDCSRVTAGPIDLI